MVNTTIQYDNIIMIIIIASAPASTRPDPRLEAEDEARTFEAEARTLEAEAEATKFWPLEASRPRPGLEGWHPCKYHLNMLIASLTIG